MIRMELVKLLRRRSVVFGGLALTVGSALVYWTYVALQATTRLAVRALSRGSSTAWGSSSARSPRC